MALTLTAEQKSIDEIFSGKSKYIIPPYQRAYSWDEEQCSELLEDITNAFLTNEEDGYFIGNIVIAKSSEERNSLEVIDGQQRLITLTLFLKILSELDSTNNALDDSIWIKDRRDRNKKEQRVQTRVFEDKDSLFLQEVLEVSSEKLCKEKATNRFIKNICLFAKELKENKKILEKIEEFANFILDRVTLLPIESTDTNQDKAREKALKIFETINNRGKPLSDSDIFKANLYSMALNSLEHKQFIERWIKLDLECENIKLKGFDIVRLFKIYSYIVRGEKEITKSEIGLRDFFIKKEYSPFKSKKYNEIMDDLFHILEAIKLYESIIIDTTQNNELSKWFQLIDIYTNSYPKDLLILFLYKNRGKDTNQYLDFSKSLVRYCYFKGSTTKIKFTIYKWMVDVIKDNWTIYYPQNNKDRDYDYLGRLYKGFGLLYSYLEDNQAIYPYKIKRLRDVTNFKYPDYSYYDKIGHTVATDIHDKELEKYDFKNFNEELYNERIAEIKQKFMEFFRNLDEN